MKVETWGRRSIDKWVQPKNINHGSYKTHKAARKRQRTARRKFGPSTTPSIQSTHSNSSSKIIQAAQQHTAKLAEVWNWKAGAGADQSFRNSYSGNSGRTMRRNLQVMRERVESVANVPGQMRITDFSAFACTGSKSCKGDHSLIADDARENDVPEKINEMVREAATIRGNGKRKIKKRA